VLSSELRRADADFGSAVTKGNRPDEEKIARESERAAWTRRWRFCPIEARMLWRISSPHPCHGQAKRSSCPDVLGFLCIYDMSDRPPKEIRPSRVSPRIPGAPKIRQLDGCDLWNDAQLPEFWKRRPV
jgi:hypothetical protein